MVKTLASNEGMQVQSLVGELRSHMPCGMTKKEEKEEGIVLVMKNRRRSIQGQPVVSASALPFPVLSSPSPPGSLP